MSSPSRPKRASNRGAAAGSEVSTAMRPLLDALRLEDIPSHLLRRAHFLAEELFAREFASEGITPRQKAALITIHQQPGLSQNALAEHLHMDRSTVADLVRRLQGSGFVARQGSESDSRAYQLFLAPAGAKLLERVLPRDAHVEQELLERLPEEYRPIFMKCLRILVDATPPEP